MTPGSAPRHSACATTIAIGNPSNARPSPNNAAHAVGNATAARV